MSAPDERMQQQHADDGADDDEPRLTADDIDEVIDDTRGDEPMEEDDSGPDDDEEAEGEGAAAQQQQQQPDGETFEDTSIAAFYSHRKSLFALALHPNFAQTGLALSGGEDDGAWIWHTHDGADVARLDGHTDSVTAVAWSADGTLAASGGMDGRVRVWAQPQQGAAWALVQSLEGPDEVVVSVGTSGSCKQSSCSCSVWSHASAVLTPLLTVARMAPKRQRARGRRFRLDRLDVAM
jgi:ribosome assembly protein SQT1